MTKAPFGVGRRTVIAGGVATVSTLAMPGVLRAATPAPVKVGIVQPTTGFLALDGDLGKLGAKLGIDDINAAGGIKSLGGAKIEMVFADNRSNPAASAQAVEQLHGQGVAAVVGGFASGLCATGTQAAARYNLPYLIDCAVADELTQRGLKNTFRFGPSFSMAAKVALANLVKLNDQAGKPAKTVVLVHEDGLFGSGIAKLMQKELPGLGFTVLDSIAHPTPARDMSNVVLRIRSLKPDLIIPSDYYAEFVLLARTLRQQEVYPKGIYSIFGGAASSLRFVKQFPAIAQGIMDCNHWPNPHNPDTQKLRQQIEAAGRDFVYNAPINYGAVHIIAQALEMAASTDSQKIIDALNTHEFDSSIMPYGKSKFVDGQNVNALPLNTQVQSGDVKVIFPAAYAQVKPIFPVPAKG